jgi:Tfp pilus assembly protein PilW
VPEALVGMSLSVLLMLGVYTVYETCQATYWRTASRSSVNQAARAGIEQLRRELRLAGSDPSATGQAAVQTMAAGTVEFVADVDDNNVSDLVRYERDAGNRTVRRTVRAWTGTAWGPAQVATVADGVQALSFQYFPTAAVPGLKRIRVLVQLSKAGGTIGSVQHAVMTDIHLRNL